MVNINKILSDKYEKYFDYLNQKMIVEQIIKRGINNPGLINALKEVKRHYFLPDNLKTRAYDDCAVEIMPNQTISQPYIVALMIDLLDIKETDKVIEIGTGTGWQTTLLAKMAKEVYSVDIRDTLYEFSRKKIFEIFKCSNVKLKIDDGSKGWKEYSPFNKIIVSCSTDNIPEELINQLSENGKMIIPVGPVNSQKLKIIEKDNNGNISIKDNLDVIFVRMEKLQNNQ